MRLANGTGFVKKLSGNRRNPYAYGKCLGWTIEGKQIQQIIGYEKTRTKAIQKLFEYNKDPFDIQNNSITFQKVCEKLFLEMEENIKNGNFSKSSMSCYKSAFNACKSVYKMKMTDIKTINIQNVIDNCKNGINSKKYIKNLFSKAFQYCIDILDMEQIKKNYALNCKINITVEKSSKHKPFSNEEINILWKNQNNWIIKTILILIYTGLRPSELLNMKKENIHDNFKYMIGGSKTNAGINRIIPINIKIKPLLEFFYESSTNDYLVTKNGCKVNYRYYLDLFKDNLNDIKGLSMHTPHDGRHTFATLMDLAEANKLCIKLIMGHSVQDITDGIYTHKNVDDLYNEINKI